MVSSQQECWVLGGEVRVHQLEVKVCGHIASNGVLVQPHTESEGHNGTQGIAGMLATDCHGAGR